MSKVITLSRSYPAYHRKKNDPTLFVEKVWKSLLDSGIDVADYIYEVGKSLNYQYADDVIFSVDISQPKHHTIRKGKRWKTGDKASLRIWSGKPYRSKQITIAPDVELTVKDIDIDTYFNVVVDGVFIPFHEDLAKNDGLTGTDLIGWFAPSLPFSGQILIWNNKTLPY